MKTNIVAHRRGLIAALATLLIVADCVGAATAVTGDIKDDGIILITDHAGSSVRLVLHNVGTTPCDLTPVLTSLSPDALPVQDGQVVIDGSGAPGTVQMAMGGAAGYLKRVMPGEAYEVEIALEGAPKTDERIILCNGAGDYARGRYAVLRFDR